MLKIKDTTGKVIGVLKDEDTQPEMNKDQVEELEEGDQEDAEVDELQ